MARPIKHNETLSGIAAENNTTIEELMRLNPNITNPNIIRAGDYINLPGDPVSDPAASQTPASASPAAFSTTETQPMKSTVAGLSDERYTQLNQKVTDYAAYQNTMNLIRQASDAIKGGTKYQQQLDDIVNQINGREKFSYDFSQDPMFMNMLASYQNQGKAAMQDTMAQASALTGGYGNTWAQTAGQQAYNQYLQEAYNNLPAYYQLALDSYNLEGDELARRYSMLSDLDKTEYNKLMDQYNMGQDAANRAVQEFESIMSGNCALAETEIADYWNRTNFDYQKQRDSIADARYASQQSAGAVVGEEPLEKRIRVGEVRWGEDGNAYITYQDEGGTKFEVPKYRNPYTRALNEDVYNGTWDWGGYQPNNIGGVPLKYTGENTTMHGHTVKVFYTDDSDGRHYWAWSDEENRYIEQEKTED